jgi:hypothetical protein
MFVTVELLYGTWGKGKEKNDGASVILNNVKCEGRRYKDVY